MLRSACPSRTLRRALGLLVVSCVVVAGVASPRAAWAQDDARFRHGVDLYQRGDYRAALTEFEAVYATSPTPALVYNLGRTLEHLGRNAEAVTRYGEYLDAGSPGMTPGARNELVGHVRELRAGLVELTVQGQPGLYVTANAMPMGTIPAVMTLDPGTYSIQAGHARQDVTLAPGEHRTIYLEEPAPAGGGNGSGSGNGNGSGSGSGSGSGNGSGSGSGSGSSSGSGSGGGTGSGGGGGLGTGAWVSLGMAGAAVVTTVITGIVALGKQSTADDLARELEDETDPARRERLARDGLDANRAGRTYATVADISLVAAAIAGGVFTVLVVSATPDARTPVTPAPPASVSLLPGGGALVTARGTW